MNMEIYKWIILTVACGTVGCLIGLLTSYVAIAKTKLSDAQFLIETLKSKVEDLDRRLKLIEKIGITGDGRMVFPHNR